MKEMKIDAVFAQGSSSSDPVMYYLLNGINVTATYIKKRGEKAYIIHNPMEREEAAKTGLRLISMNRYDMRSIYNKQKDRLKASAMLWKTALDSLKVKGNVAFYGSAALGYGFNFLKYLIRLDKKIEIAYEPDKNIIMKARETKDLDEVSSIKKAGQRVAQAFDATIRQVQAMKVINGTIIREKGKKLRIGDLKNIMRTELYERGLVNSAGLIIAQGRDAGIPHNSGQNQEPVKLGRTIVFDIYPQFIGGGYYFDFTRTVCFGYAVPKYKEIYQQVKDAQDFVYSRLKVATKTRNVEIALCKFFEKHGHPTFFTNPKTEIGYCHSLGHGVGLNIHENPGFSLFKNNKDILAPGMVFTVEPGLYYPDKGFGVRLEDIVYIDKKGRLVELTKCPRNLVVEI